MQKACSLPILAVLSGAVMLMLTGCADTPAASARAKPTAAGHPTMPEDNLPNPARNVLDGPSLERMQSGVPIGHPL